MFFNSKISVFSLNFLYLVNILTLFMHCFLNSLSIFNINYFGFPIEYCIYSWLLKNAGLQDTDPSCSQKSMYNLLSALLFMQFFCTQGSSRPLILHSWIKPTDECVWLKTQHSKDYNHGIWSHYFMAYRWGNNGKSDWLHLLGLQNNCRWWLQPWN